MLGPAAMWEFPFLPSPTSHSPLPKGPGSSSGWTTMLLNTICNPEWHEACGAQTTVQQRVCRQRLGHGMGSDGPLIPAAGIRSLCLAHPGIKGGSSLGGQSRSTHMDVSWASAEEPLRKVPPVLQLEEHQGQGCAMLGAAWPSSPRIQGGSAGNGRELLAQHSPAASNQPWLRFPNGCSHGWCLWTHELRAGHLLLPHGLGLPSLWFCLVSKCFLPAPHGMSGGQCWQ